MIFHHGVVIVPMPFTGAPTTGTWESGTIITDNLGDQYKCVASGTPGTWKTLVSANQPVEDIVDSFPEFIDTFVNGAQAGMGWSIALHGGGAVLTQIAPPSGAGGRNAVVGVIQANTGTSTTGRAGAILGSNLLRFQSGAMYSMWCRFLAAQLATATDNYRFRVGFIDRNTGTAPQDGAYFEYNLSASANWQCKTASNNTRTTVTTTTAVQNANWIDLKIVVDGSVPTATFYIDDVQVAQINTNIPQAAGRETSLGFVIYKTAGGNARYVMIDRIYMKLKEA